MPIKPITITPSYEKSIFNLLSELIVLKTFINVNLPRWPPRHKFIVCNINLIECFDLFHDVTKRSWSKDNRIRLSLLLFELIWKYYIFKTLNKDLIFKYKTTCSKKIWHIIKSEMTQKHIFGKNMTHSLKKIWQPWKEGQSEKSCICFF